MSEKTVAEARKHIAESLEWFTSSRPEAAEIVSREIEKLCRAIYAEAAAGAPSEKPGPRCGNCGKRWASADEIDEAHASGKCPESALSAKIAESLPAQPKAEAGEPSGEAPEPLPEVLERDGRTVGGTATPKLVFDGKHYCAPGWQIPPANIDWAHWRSTRAATTATDAGTGDEGTAGAPGYGCRESGKAVSTSGVGVESPVPVHPSQEQPAASGPGEALPNIWLLLTPGEDRYVPMTWSYDPPDSEPRAAAYLRSQSKFSGDRIVEYAPLVTPPAQAEKPLLFPDHAPDCLKQKGAMRLQGMPGAQTFIRCTCGKEAEKPSGGAPSEPLSHDLSCLTRAGGACDCGSSSYNAGFEVGAASRDAEVAAYERFVEKLGGDQTLTLGISLALVELRRELAALEAKGKP